MSKYGLTKEKIESHIADVEYQRFGKTGTLCVITLCNGYTVTGESRCIDPEIFHEGTGENIAYENAFEKLWGILGYVEKQRWHEETQLSWLDRVKQELADLDIKRGKLADFLSRERPDTISEAEWGRLNQQSEAMSQYAFILSDRIINAEKPKD